MATGLGATGSGFPAYQDPATSLSSGSYTEHEQSFTVADVAGEDTFLLSFDPVDKQYCEIFIDSGGTLSTPTQDDFELVGQSIVLDTAAAQNDVVTVRYRAPVSSVTVTAEDGRSAYEVAVFNGFVGTEEEWLASLVGEQGPQGEPAPEQPLSIAAKADKNESTIPASLAENIIVTADGRVLLRREGETLFLGTARFDVDGGFVPLLVKNEAGYASFMVGNDGTVSFAGVSAEPDPFSFFRVQTENEKTLLDFDRQTGGMRAVLSPDRFEMSGPDTYVDGLFASGVVSGVHASGQWFGYHIDGPEFSGKVIGRKTNDWAAPHFVDAAVFDVIEADGQSWQTMSDFTPDEIDVEETTGETGAAVRAALSPMVASLRNANFVDDVLPDDDYSGQLPTPSNGSVAGELHAFAPKNRFSTAQMSALVRARFQARFGLPANPSIVQHVGWPGTSSEKFLPDGSSYNYTDDDGNAQTTTAVSHPDAGAFLWDRNIERRDALKDVIDSKWFGRKLRYEFLTWIQGPFDDYGNALGFMGEYRAQQDALVIPDQTGTRHILWDQRGGETDDLELPNGIQAQLEFPQQNSSGKDWLVGPRYPHWLRDRIHHSSFGALEYAERTGQAMAYIQKYGEWQPLWIESVSISGADVTLTTNRPRQCVGDLVIDADAITAAPDHGFTLWDDVANTQIAISSVSVSGNTITLTAGATLSGDIEVGYAARGTSAQPTGTVAAPSHSATWGNIKMTGRDAPAVIPAYVQPTLDHWLCSYKKVHTV